MRITKLISAFAAVMLLAACASDDDAAMDDTAGATGSAAGTGTAAPTTAVTLSPQEQLEQIGDRVFYDFNRFDLTPQARQSVEQWADWMRANPAATVVIEGHADERGTREYNLALGERRANSAKNYLAALGTEPGRIVIVSFGKERPAVVGSNDYAWAQNRRGVLVVQ